MPPIVIAQMQAGPVPVLTVNPEGAGRLPTVFYMHGFGGRKEHGLELGYRLARRGFLFVAFDAVAHGARADGRLERFDDPAQLVYPQASGLDRYLFMHEVVVQNAADLDTDSPKVCSVRLYRALLPAYVAQPDRLRLKIYDGAHHQVTEQMLDDACEWFDRHLGMSGDA